MSKFDLTEEEIEKLINNQPVFDNPYQGTLFSARNKLHGQWIESNTDLAIASRWPELPVVGQPVILFEKPSVILEIIDLSIEYTPCVRHDDFTYKIFTECGEVYTVYLEIVEPWPQEVPTPDWMEPLIYAWKVKQDNSTSETASKPSETVAEVTYPEETETPNKRLPETGDRVRWIKSTGKCGDLIYGGETFIANRMTLESYPPQEVIGALSKVKRRPYFSTLTYYRHSDCWEFVDED